MIVPSSDDLEAHGFWTERIMLAIGDLYAAQTALELELSKLPSWYQDRLKALATDAPAEARITWLTDAMTARRRRSAADWPSAYQAAAEPSATVAQ
jgi:hypothetical protein